MFVTAAQLVDADRNSVHDVCPRSRNAAIHAREFSWRVAPADGSSNADISADGRFVVFESVATNLTNEELPPDLTAQVFLRDREVGVTRLLTTTSDGKPNGPS